MTSIALTSSSSCFSSKPLSDFVPFFCAGSTDDAFRRVVVNRLNEDGSVKYYEKISGGNGESFKDLYYIEDVATGNLYVNDPKVLVAQKCAAIFFLSPFYALTFLSFTLCKSAAVVVGAALSVFNQIHTQSLNDAPSIIVRGIKEIADALTSGVWSVVKTPFCWIAVEACALYGMFYPYHGRKYEAMVENFWQGGHSYREDFNRIKARKNETCPEACLKDVQSAPGAYLAQCFQVRGNVNDLSRFRVVRRDSL